MRLSQLFTRTLRQAPQGEQAVNAQLLERAGFVYKNSAGVYSYLPLGWRVMGKISNIIRDEMDRIDGQEMLMPALVEKRYLDATGRWEVDVGFKVSEQYVLGWTHVGVLTEIATRYVSSYKDLPFAAYQIQTKFRNEARAKSGLLRGREFTMKDLYSFHVSEEDLFKYYEKVRQAYNNIFTRAGLRAYYTLASGGAFTISNTHEFQVLSEVGEDTIRFCSDCEYAENVEVSRMKKGDRCPKCGSGQIEEASSIEVGNIFLLGTKYSEAFGLKFTDKDGQTKPVVMGSYGIGLGRLMATVVETSHDERGIIWPASIAPFQVHVVVLGNKELAEEAYVRLKDRGIEVLMDDREEMSAGEKFADADLLGIPQRVVISDSTESLDRVETKHRIDKVGQTFMSVDLIPD